MPVKAPKKASAESKRAAPAGADTASNAVDEQLARYRSMRDFSVTAEPAGSGRSKKSEKNKDGAGLPICTTISGWAGTAC
jgi:bifunctional non-homologous end joining protein LigD